MRATTGWTLTWTLAVCLMTASDAWALPPGSRDLYLASRDEIRLVERRLAALPASPGGTFVGIIGGLASLNFIERLQPTHILLVDLNPAQVAYGRCIVELIKHAPNREAFVSALFSRPFQADEQAFLAQPGDLARLDAATRPISDPALRASCATDLTLIANAAYDPKTRALIVERNANGKFLQRDGPARGMPRGYNFLYFGRGWLASEEAFQRTQAALTSARVRFLASDIGAVPVDDLQGSRIVFWGSNLATWFQGGRDAYERFIVRAHESFASRNKDIHFFFLSTYRLSAITHFIPFTKLGSGVHLDVSAKVRKRVEGRHVLELIPGRAYFGRELRAQDIIVQNAREPIDPKANFDTAVLHILNNSGMKWWDNERSSAFRALYDAVLQRASTVVILEHNRASSDFSDKERNRMVGLDELLRPLFPLLAKQRLTLTYEPGLGETDHHRNFVLTIQR